MRRLALISTLAVLALAGCGGDDEDTTTTTGATGSAGVTGADGIHSADVETAGDYMQASIPDQGEAVQRLAEAEPDCEGVDTKLGSDFQVAVAIAAASASADTSLAEIVNNECNES